MLYRRANRFPLRQVGVGLVAVCSVLSIVTVIVGLDALAKLPRKLFHKSDPGDDNHEEGLVARPIDPSCWRSWQTAKEEGANPPRVNWFLIWTTPVETFALRHRRGLESILKYSGDRVAVRVYSNTLPLNMFDVFNDMGYVVDVVRYDVKDLVKGTRYENLKFISRIDEYRVKAKEWFDRTGISDFLRLILLYKYGGIYGDWDIIVLRRGIEELTNAVALSRSRNRISYVNGFLAFQKGHPFLDKVIHVFDRRFTPELWVSGGPLVIVDAMKKYPGMVSCILPPIFVVPVSSKFVSERLILEDEPAFYDYILAHSYGFHWYNSGTGKVVDKLRIDSVIGRLWTEHCILCDEGKTIRDFFNENEGKLFDTTT